MFNTLIFLSTTFSTLWQTANPTSYLPLGKILAGVSLGLAGLLMIGGLLFGRDAEDKAKRQVMGVIIGLILFSVGGLFINTF